MNVDPSHCIRIRRDIGFIGKNTDRPAVAGIPEQTEMVSCKSPERIRKHRDMDAEKPLDIFF